MKKFIWLDLNNFRNFFYLILISFWISCSPSSKPDQSIHDKIGQNTKEYKKPPSNYQDTLDINTRSAVFYGPDSLQLEKIKSATDAQIFDGSMHEYFFQVKTAHSALKQNWPKIQAIDSKNVRFLNFVRRDNKKEVIDLNDYNDAYGVFIFDTEKSPVLVDMTNFEDALYLYFGK